MKTRLLLLSLSAALLLPACGSSSPESYIEATAKLSCQYLEKCEEAMWEEAGFDSVKDCRDMLLDTDLGGEGTLRDNFVESCTDFDKGAARKCLAAGRKAKRSCEDLETVEEPACEEVCGAPASMGLGLGPDPLTDELVTRALEAMIDDGELELEDELTADPSLGK